MLIDYRAELFSLTQELTKHTVIKDYEQQHAENKTGKNPIHQVGH